LGIWDLQVVARARATNAWATRVASPPRNYSPTVPGVFRCASRRHKRHAPEMSPLELAVLRSSRFAGLEFRCALNRRARSGDGNDELGAGRRD